MNTAIRAYLDEHGSTQTSDPVLYIERDQRGPLMVVPTRGFTGERFNLPGSAVELIHPDAAVATVLELIADVPMPKKVREQIAERLGVDVEKVGRANARRAA
jgi:hypothetical protein